MRALLAALLLAAAAAVATVPSASASPGLFVCAPSTASPAACVYVRFTACAYTYVEPTASACWDPSRLDAQACVEGSCTWVLDSTTGVVVCVPPHALNGACAGHTDDGYCAWYWLGSNFSIACASTAPGVEACSDHLWDDDPATWIECKTVPA